jgi:hypothetical protein
VLGLNSLSLVSASLNDTFFVSERQVGLVLLGRSDPTIANKQAPDIPNMATLSSRCIFVAFQNASGDVRDILASVRFTSKINLSKHQRPILSGRGRSTRDVVHRHAHIQGKA